MKKEHQSPAQLVTSPYLNSLLVDHRDEFRPYYLDLARALADTTDGELQRFGRRISPCSLVIDQNRCPAILSHIARSFLSIFEGYRIENGMEIWLGSAPPVPNHIDSNLYLGSGRSVVVQVWILLDYFDTNDPEGEPTNNGALECVLPRVPGVMYYGLEKPFVPDGPGSFGRFVDLPDGPIIGGEQMKVGDVLLFANGVMHRKKPSPKGLLRVAMVQRFIRTQEPEEVADPNYMKWFNQARLNVPELQAYDEMANERNPYYVKHKELWSHLDDDIDFTALSKIDRNDYDRLASAIASLGDR